MLKNQKFGVEIEFTGITRRKAAGIVAKVLGCEVGRSAGSPYFTRTMIDAEGRSWKVMRDSSIIPMRSVGDASEVCLEGYDDFGLNKMEYVEAVLTNMMKECAV